MRTLVVIGGGAAGFFGAINAAEKNRADRVILLEKTATLLAKVRISGGGRCNVTHACFEPKQLVQNYPRGGKALLGPFHRFQPKDTIAWFEQRGVELKTEEDGRMFPITDSSQTIIACLMQAADNAGVEIRLQQKIETLDKVDGKFHVAGLEADAVLLATGSQPKGLALAEKLGHTLVPLVPSLFTFNIPNFPLEELAGISVDPAQVDMGGVPQKGPLLITHWGFSGPAALKLSAWEARTLHSHDYQTTLHVNWLPSISNLADHLLSFKSQNGPQTLSRPAVPLPRNLWKKLLEIHAFDPQKRWCDLPNKELLRLASLLQKDPYPVSGKTTYKQEFVTCGGIPLDEVNFKTLESRLCPGLFFAGEILDIDGITGGFNFQNAWTTSYLASQAM